MKTLGYCAVLRLPGQKMGKRMGQGTTPTEARKIAYDRLLQEDIQPGTFCYVYRIYRGGLDYYWFVGKDKEGVFDIGYTRQYRALHAGHISSSATWLAARFLSCQRQQRGGADDE